MRRTLGLKREEWTEEIQDFAKGGAGAATDAAGLATTAPSLAHLLAHPALGQEDPITEAAAVGDFVSPKISKHPPSSPSLHIPIPPCPSSHSFHCCCPRGERRFKAAFALL